MTSYLNSVMAEKQDVDPAPERLSHTLAVVPKHWDHVHENTEQFRVEGTSGDHLAAGLPAQSR